MHAINPIKVIGPGGGGGGLFTLGVATPGVDRGKVQLLLLRTSRTNKLPSWSTVLPEKLTAAQLLKKLPAFYATRRFITAVSKAQHLSLSWARSIQSIPISHSSKIYFNIIFQQRTSLKLLKNISRKLKIRRKLDIKSVQSTYIYYPQAR